MVGILPVVERAARLALNLQGFESRTVQTSAAALHVYDTVGLGKLPTTVVLHGIGSAATPFGRVLTRLRPHAKRVLAPDLPGHGFSGQPDVPMSPDALFAAFSETLEQLVDEPIVLIGNSLGGALTLRYALEHPRSVRALVLLSPAGARISEPEWQTLLDTFRIESTRDARLLLDRLYHRMPFYMPAFAAGLRASLQRDVVRELLASVKMEHLPEAERLRELSMPVLLLWGQSERIFPASALEYFRVHLPEHAIVEQPHGFGHCPHIDAPARLSARVIEFLSHHAAPRQAAYSTDLSR